MKLKKKTHDTRRQRHPPIANYSRRRNLFRWWQKQIYYHLHFRFLIWNSNLPFSLMNERRVLDLQPSTFYEARVISENSCCRSQPSGIVNFQTKTPPPQPPLLEGRRGCFRLFVCLAFFLSLSLVAYTRLYKLLCQLVSRWVHPSVNHAIENCCQKAI